VQPNADKDMHRCEVAGGRVLQIWIVYAAIVLDRNRLDTLLSGLKIERMKAVFTTQEGVCGYDTTPDCLT